MDVSLSHSAIQPEIMNSAKPLNAPGMVALWLRRKFPKKLNLALSAERQNLVDWIRDIEQEVLPALQATDVKHKRVIEELRDFVDGARSAINEFDQSASVRHSTVNKFLHLLQAKAPKEKLKKRLEDLKMWADLVKDHTGDHVQRSLDTSSCIAYSEERYRTLVGIEEPVCELLKWLTKDDSKSKVIFVHGAPGSGKTSLVGALLRNPEMRKCFQYYVWIKDLRTWEWADNIYEALKAIIWVSTDDGYERHFDQKKLQDVFRLVDGSKWVLVLDDASKAQVFNSLAIPLFQTRPSVLVTTRIGGLAYLSEYYLARVRSQSHGISLNSSEPWYHFENFKLPSLSTGDSRQLFWESMPVKYRSVDESTVDIDSILKKCGGSPLAIQAMCEHLIREQGSYDNAQLGEWSTWSDSLQFSPLLNYEERGSIRRMMIQCMDCAHDIRNSVLYLSIFLLDCPLRYSTLMRLWMAEGLPEESLKRLVEHNFFQELKRTSYGKLRTCRLNNLLHQIIISKSIKDEFAMIVADNITKGWPFNMRRLSIHNTPSIKVTGRSAESLISLHVSKELDQEYLIELLGHCRKIKVLDLQRHSSKAKKNIFQGSSRFPIEILHMKHLTYLSLRDTNVNNIPNEIGNLQCLETLDLKGTEVHELPKGISKLKKLLHLLVYRSDRSLAAGTDLKHGAKAPSELGELKLLRTLCMIDLDPDGQVTPGGPNDKRKVLPEAIGKLTNLRRLGLSMMGSTSTDLDLKVMDHLFSSIGKLTNLEALRIIVGPKLSIVLSDEDVRKVPINLKRVHLTGCLRTSPNQILSLTRVVKLVLKGSNLNGDPLQHLQELRRLKHLELQQAFDVTDLRFTAEWFKELGFLGLDKIDRLQSIIVDEGALPALETLSLARCMSFEPVLQDITRPKNLKCLKLKGMSEEFMKVVEENGTVPKRIKVDHKDRKDEPLVGHGERGRQPPTGDISRSTVRPFHGGGPAIEADNDGQVLIASNCLSTAMEFFSEGCEVYLRSSHRQYLFGVADGTVTLSDQMLNGSQWSVEFVPNSRSILRLKNSSGKYLAASDEPSFSGMTGCKVVQSLPPLLDSSLEFEPVMEGTQIKLRTHYGTFLRANVGHPLSPEVVTHDLPHRTTLLWDVEPNNRGRFRSASHTDIKAWEEGSASNVDYKALEVGSAIKWYHETGEEKSVTESTPGNSGQIKECDGVRYRRHFWKLKSLLLDDSRRKDVLVRGGLGTTALVREVCADVREHFGTIAWISIPQKYDHELISEELLLLQMFERAAFPENFERDTWSSTDPEFSLEQKARCLIVVDNLDDQRTWEKFEEVLRKVKTCRVIFVVRQRNDSFKEHGRQIEEHGRKFEPYDLVPDLSYVPRAHHFKDFLEKASPFPSKGVCQLIVTKCERLPTAIIFLLCNQVIRRPSRSSETIKDEWEARIPSANLCEDLLVIQQVLKTRYKDLYEDKRQGLDQIQRVVDILWKDDLGSCFSYLSIFPEDRPIGCKTVSRLWAAEGLLNDLERAGHFFNDLLLRKCIHPVEIRSDGELSTFIVDKHARKIIVSLSDLRNPITITSPGNTNWPERVTLLSVQGTIRAFSEEKTYQISSIFVPDVSSSEDKATTSEASPLETDETPSFLSNLKDAKVLDLESVPFQVVPEALLEQSTNASYLSFRNTSIRAIPGSIGKLTNLEFLDAKHSLVTELPEEVVIPEKIRHILIYHHEIEPLTGNYNLIGIKAPWRVGGFKNLEKLCFVEADEGILEDLGKLTKLRRLGITKLREEHGELLRTALGKLKELKSLNLHALDEDEILDLHYPTSPPESKSRTSPSESQTSSPESMSQTLTPKLKSVTSPSNNLIHLYLHGRLKKLPVWISSRSLQLLTKLILGGSHLEEDLLASLGELPELVELELHRAYDGKRLDFKTGQFPKLKILLLEQLEGLRSMSMAPGTLESLTNLTISRCPWLESIPSGIRYIGTIQELTFFDMSDGFYEKVGENKEGEDYKKITAIKAHFKRWRAGHWESAGGED